MTKQAELRGLLEQVVNAEGPSRELSQKVLCAALAPATAYVEQSPINGEWCIYDGTTSKGGGQRLWGPRDLPRELRLGDITASLDAALAFTERALPGVKGFSGEPSVGWKFGVYRLTQPGLWTAWVRQHANDGVEVKQRTPALALVAAVLKALIEQESE